MTNEYNYKILKSCPETLDIGILFKFLSKTKNSSLRPASLTDDPSDIDSNCPPVLFFWFEERDDAVNQFIKQCVDGYPWEVPWTLESADSSFALSYFSTEDLGVLQRLAQSKRATDPTYNQYLLNKIELLSTEYDAYTSATFTRKEANLLKGLLDAADQPDLSTKLVYVHNKWLLYPSQIREAERIVQHSNQEDIPITDDGVAWIMQNDPEFGRRANKDLDGFRLYLRKKIEDYLKRKERAEQGIFKGKI